jgi:hypothetical protein
MVRQLLVPREQPVLKVFKAQLEQRDLKEQLEQLVLKAQLERLDLKA